MITTMQDDNVPPVEIWSGWLTQFVQMRAHLGVGCNGGGGDCISKSYLKQHPHPLFIGDLMLETANLILRKMERWVWQGGVTMGITELESTFLQPGYSVILRDTVGWHTKYISKVLWAAFQQTALTRNWCGVMSDPLFITISSQKSQLLSFGRRYVCHSIPQWMAKLHIVTTDTSSLCASGK